MGAQGKVQITTEVEEVVKTVATSAPSHAPTVAVSAKQQKQIKTTTKEQPFMFLSLDIPPPPLFPGDKDKGTIIPQEPLFTLLRKFDGETKQFVPATNEWKRYKITRLPRYLVLHLNRFTKNNFFVEKNPTIVNFPLRDLDMVSLSLASFNSESSIY